MDGWSTQQCSKHWIKWLECAIILKEPSQYIEEFVRLERNAILFHNEVPYTECMSQYLVDKWIQRQWKIWLNGYKCMATLHMIIWAVSYEYDAHHWNFAKENSESFRPFLSVFLNIRDSQKVVILGRSLGWDLFRYIGNCRYQSELAYGFSILMWWCSFYRK